MGEENLNSILKYATINSLQPAPLISSANPATTARVGTLQKPAV